MYATLPKAGLNPSENEDDVLIHQAGPQSLRICVADGATESAFARQWSQCICAAFTRYGPAITPSPDTADKLTLDCSAWLKRLRGRWDRCLQRRSLPWWAEQKALLGTWATFLGLEITTDASKLRMSACGVGDVCLFQVSDGRRISSWPISSYQEFANQPNLVGTICTKCDSVPRITLAVDSGNSFYIASDAIAKWLLEYETEHRWMDLPLDDDAEFSNWIDLQRSTGRLRNDDITLLRMRVT